MNLKIIGLTTAITIGPVGKILLKRIIVSEALTGTCVITGFGDSADAATSITFAAATPPGSYEIGAINTVGPLTVTCSNALDDNLVAVVWDAL